MHELIGQDLWQLGKDKFSKRDVVALRSEADRHRQNKSDMRACIISSIQSTMNGSDIEIREDIEYMPSWQRHVRLHDSNLR